jgi:hypothetical protein
VHDPRRRKRIAQRPRRFHGLDPGLSCQPNCLNGQQHRPLGIDRDLLLGTQRQLIAARQESRLLCLVALVDRKEGRSPGD